MTIALHRAGEAGEEVLRLSGDLGWTSINLPTAIPGRLPVEGVSICYEKGADSSDAGLDRAGVDNIRLDRSDPLLLFCSLAVVGGNSGRSCGVLAKIGDNNNKVKYQPADRPWLVSDRPMNQGLALFSVPIDSGASSCLRLSLELSPGQRLGVLNVDYIVSAGASTGALTIALHRDEEAPEEILRASRKQPWTRLQHSVDPERGQVSDIFMCYQQGTAIGDADLTWAGVDNILLLAANPVADFCDVAVAGGRSGPNCVPLDVDSRLSYGLDSPWVLGSDASGSGLALFSADVGSGGNSCLQLQFLERDVLTELSLDYRALAEGSGGEFTLVLHRNGEADEFVFRRDMLETAWTRLVQGIDFERARVTGISVCYLQATGGSDTVADRVGLDNLGFAYESTHDRNNFCDSVVKGGRTGANCAWIQAVYSVPGQLRWVLKRGGGENYWSAPRTADRSPILPVGEHCTHLRLHPHLGLAFANGLSFSFVLDDAFPSVVHYTFYVRPLNGEFARLGSETFIGSGAARAEDSSRSVQFGAVGPVSDVLLCRDRRRGPDDGFIPFGVREIELQEAAEMSTLTSIITNIPARLLYAPGQPVSVDFAVQALDQFGLVFDPPVQPVLTVRSGISDMRLSLTVPETGQSASGDGEVSLPLSFSGEQNLVLGLGILGVAADGTTLAVTVGEYEAVMESRREVSLFDFCAPAVYGGRDSEGGSDLRLSCSNFAGAVSAVYFDPPDSAWRLADPESFVVASRNLPFEPPEKPWRAPGQTDLRLFGPSLDSGEKSCMHLQINPAVTITRFSLHWFLTVATDADFYTISLARANEIEEEQILGATGGRELWAPLTYTVNRGQLSRISFCYERAPRPRFFQKDGAGVDNLRLEYTLPPVEFTGDEAMTKDDLLLALRAVRACSEPATREDCIAMRLSALAANLGLGALDTRMASITEALLALNSTVTRSVYDFDRSGAVDDMDFRVLLRYFAGLRGAALAEKEGDDSPNEAILRTLLDR